MVTTARYQEHVEEPVHLATTDVHDMLQLMPNLFT